MSAQIIQFVPRPNPNRVTADIDHIAETVIKGALADSFIIPEAFKEVAPYGGQGIDGMDLGKKE
jgi:hypothetical protein